MKDQDLCESLVEPALDVVIGNTLKGGGAAGDVMVVLEGVTVGVLLSLTGGDIETAEMLFDALIDSVRERLIVGA